MNWGLIAVFVSVCTVLYVWRALSTGAELPKASENVISCVLFHRTDRGIGEQRIKVCLPSEHDIKGISRGVSMRIEECKAAWKQMNKQFPNFSFQDLLQSHRNKLVKKLLEELEASISMYKAQKWNVSALCPELSVEALSNPEALDNLIATVTAKKALQGLPDIFIISVTPEKQLVERDSDAEKLRNDTERFLHQLRQLCVVTYALHLIKRCHDKVDTFNGWLSWQALLSTALPALVTVAVFYYQQMRG